jgi:hypothetical protein
MPSAQSIIKGVVVTVVGLIVYNQIKKYIAI